MARALKPTKKEIVSTLIDRIRAQHKVKAASLTDRRQTLNEERTKLSKAINDALLETSDKNVPASKLKLIQSLGLAYAVVPPVVDDQGIHCTVRITGNVSYTVKPTKAIKDMIAARADIDHQRAVLYQEATAHDNAAKNADLLALVEELLSDEATPHLEALQELVGRIIADKHKIA